MTRQRPILTGDTGRRERTQPAERLFTQREIKAVIDRYDLWLTEALPRREELKPPRASPPAPNSAIPAALGGGGAILLVFNSIVQHS